jgi:hypothetical protein
MTHISAELLSPYQILLGFKITKDQTEYLDEHGPTKFSQIEIGLLFFYFRITKYKLKKEE